MVWTGQNFSVGQILTAAQMTNLQNDITALAVGDAGAPKIQAAAIDTDAVGSSEIAPNSVGNSEMADNAIGNAEMASNAIGNAEMLDNAIGNAEMLSDAINTAEIVNLAVTEGKLASAVSAQLVTNGDSHNHSGGDGASIPNSAVIGLGSLALKNGVAQGDIDANSVGQSEIKTTSQEISFSAASEVLDNEYFTPTGGIYILGADFKCNDRTTGSSTAVIEPWNNDLTTSYVNEWRLGTYNNENTPIVIYSRLYYINSSPPYDLGFGEIPLFIFVKRSIDTKDIISISLSPDAPWHYNGPTIITPSGYDDEGKPYRIVSMAEYDLMLEGKTLSEQLRTNRTKTLSDIAIGGKASYEITQEIKNADISLIPQPFSRLNVIHEVVVINPQSNVCIDMLALHSAGASVAELFHNGDVVIGSVPLIRGFDSSVKCFDITYAV